MSKFRVYLGRITLFPQLGSSVRNAAELYERMWEKMPDAFQSSQNGVFPGSTAQGVIGHFQFIAQQQPGRLDFTFQPVAKHQEADLVTFDPQTNLYQDFCTVADRLPHALEGTALNRVAAYLQLGCIAQDSIEANRLLVDKMPEGYVLPLKDDEDLIFQINRPKQSKHSDGARMNYIVKWSVDRVTQMTILGPTPSGEPSAPIVKNFLVSTISLDNSSAPKQEPLEHHLSFKLLRESFEAFRTQLSDLKVGISGF